jgi:hypothetical protein
MDADAKENQSPPENNLIKAPYCGASFLFIGWGVILLVMVHLFCLDFLPNSEMRQVCPVTIEGQARRAEMERAKSLDRVADVTAGANALLTVSAGAKTNPVVDSYLEFYYYRLSYDLYPRRLYVAPAADVVNHGSDLRQIDFSPAPQWLAERNVRFVLTFGGDVASGRLLWLSSLEGWERSRAGQSKSTGASQ